jgi:hypothetical protein
MIISEGNRLARTHLCALTATSTTAFAKAELGLVSPALRIMTPPALQWTAFEKHRRTNPRAVMYGVLLYIEYKSLYL